VASFGYLLSFGLGDFESVALLAVSTLREDSFLPSSCFLSGFLAYSSIGSKESAVSTLVAAAPPPEFLDAEFLDGEGPALGPRGEGTLYFLVWPDLPGRLRRLEPALGRPSALSPCCLRALGRSSTSVASYRPPS